MKKTAFGRILLLVVTAFFLHPLAHATDLIITVKKDGDVVVSDHRHDTTPVDTNSVHATLDTETMVLTLKYDKSYDVSNINVYKDGNMVSSLYQTVYAGEYLYIDLSHSGCGEYYIIIENGNEIRR